MVGKITQRELLVTIGIVDNLNKRLDNEFSGDFYMKTAH